MLLHPVPMTGAEVRQSCTPDIEDDDRRERILADEDALVSEEARFRAAAAGGTARAFTASAFSPAVKEDMVWYYDVRLVGSVPGGPIVKKIRALSKGRCAFCHIALASTLDHSFPKAVHPRLAVDPHNLVPACRDCNSGRGVGSGVVSISPYFDHWVESTPWLSAEVQDSTKPETLTYTVRRSEQLTVAQWEALEEFFKDADIAARYAASAIDAFSPLATELRNSYGAPPVTEVRRILTERYEARVGSVGANRWETAAYKAWLDSVSTIDWEHAGIV